MPRRVSAKRREYLKRREESFSTDFKHTELPRYNALHDHNLRHFFENRRVQKHLAHLGMIDPSGRIIDLDKANSKLAIIDHEFRHAEKAEFWRQKEEAELRRRVQAKRFESLEKARFDERMAKVKEDRRIRKEIVTATLLATGQGQSTLTR